MRDNPPVSIGLNENGRNSVTLSLSATDNNHHGLDCNFFLTDTQLLFLAGQAVRILTKRHKAGVLDADMMKSELLKVFGDE